MSDFNLDTKIWRYISFEKFIQLLYKKELYFSTANQFDDTWEMYPPRAFLEPNVWEVLFKDNVAAIRHGADLSLLAQDAISFFSYVYQNKDKEYSFSCWSYEKQDCATLWELFTDKRSAVSISTTPRKVFEAYKHENHSRMQSLIIGCVNYINYESLEFPVFDYPIYHKDSNHELAILKDSKTWTLPFFYKKEAYSAEKEVRVSIFSGQNKDALRGLEFDIETLIEDVIIPPQANESFIEHIKYLCEAHLPETRVSESKLSAPDFLDGEEYQQKHIRGLQVNNEKRAYNLYIVFENIDGFNTWHEKVCRYLGYPRIGRNGATGAYAFDACGTFDWSLPQPHPSSEKVYASATKSLSFDEYELVGKDELKNQGWFQEEQDEL